MKDILLDGMGFLALLALLYVGMVMVVPDSTAQQSLVMPTEVTK